MISYIQDIELQSFREKIAHHCGGRLHQQPETGQLLAERPCKTAPIFTCEQMDAMLNALTYSKDRAPLDEYGEKQLTPKEIYARLSALRPELLDMEMYMRHVVQQYRDEVPRTEVILSYLNMMALLMEKLEAEASVVAMRLESGQKT